MTATRLAIDAILMRGIDVGVPAIRGANGVETIVEVPLDNTSGAQMQKMAGASAADVQAGGDLKLPE
jgi:malate/lactate dehydrogenase